MDVEIIPSILLHSEKEFLAQTGAVAEYVNIVQLDIADGVFVPNTTWADPKIVSEKLEIDCELHLMVRNPLETAREWAGVDQVKRVLVHYESDPEHLGNILSQIQSYGWEVGTVLNPDTPTSVLDPFMEELDAVMFMGVQPGFQHQKFNLAVLEKITKFRAAYPNIFISIDGGVNEGTLEKIARTGVSAVCPGSALFGNDRAPKENIERMREILRNIKYN